MIAKRNLEEERSVLRAQKKQEKDLEKLRKEFGKTAIIQENFCCQLLLGKLIIF